MILPEIMRETTFIRAESVNYNAITKYRLACSDCGSDEYSIGCMSIYYDRKSDDYKIKLPFSVEIALTHDELESMFKTCKIDGYEGVEGIAILRSELDYNTFSNLFFDKS